MRDDSERAESCEEADCRLARRRRLPDSGVRFTTFDGNPDEVGEAKLSCRRWTIGLAGVAYIFNAASRSALGIENRMRMA